MTENSLLVLDVNQKKGILGEAEDQGQGFLYWSQTNNVYFPVQEIIAIDIKNEKIYVKVKNATRGVSFIAEEPSEQKLIQKFGNKPRDIEFSRQGTSLRYLLPKKD